MTDFNVKTFDDDGIDHSNDFDPVTDEGWFTPSDFGTLGTTYPFFLKHYNFDESQEIGATGTGLFNPFLNMNGDSTLLGFNTNEDIKKPYTDAGFDISDPNTDAIQLGDIPIVYLDLDGLPGLEAYYQINLDINENQNKDVSLEELQLFTSTNPATLADYTGGSIAFGGGFTLRFDLDATGDNKLLLEDDGAGQGKLDYTFYFPVSMFAGSSPTDYLTLFSQFGPTPPDDAGFAEWNVLAAAKIDGIKFLDVNADGVRDANGVDNISGNSDDEVGLGGFTMYIDTNGNNKLDVGEQTALTASDGSFEFASLLPNATYVIREVLTAADVGAGLNFSDYDPPAGIWDETTDNPAGSGDMEVSVTTGTTNILVGNHLLVPSLNITKTVTSITGGQGTDGLDGADSDGDVINYAIAVENTGEVVLTGLTVKDAVEGGSSVDATPVTSGGFNTGDSNTNGAFDPGEIWNFTATYTVTQTDLNNKGGGDGDIDNIATADSNETGPDTDDAVAPLIYDPELNITKTVTSITGGQGTGGLDGADSDGDVINYAITVENTGNITLTGLTVTDAVEGGSSVAATPVTSGGFNTGDTNTNGAFDPGEIWNFTASYTVTQDDLNNKGGGDGDIDNIATADSNETGPDTDDAVAPLIYDPEVDITKFVNVDPTAVPPDASDANWDDANGPGLGPQNVNLGTDVWFKVTVENTGNIDLTGVDIHDVNNTTGAPPSSTFDLMTDGALTADAINNHNAVLTGDDGDGVLETDETWTIIYSQAFDPGEHSNTASVTDDQNATDSDDAHYFSLVDEGLCPRTPGFWQNMNNGGQFWDGVAGAKHAGEAGFPTGELMYAVDSDGDGNINVGVKGLLIGDYDHDGTSKGADGILGTSDDEDVLFVSYADALQLINASNKQLNSLSGDGKFMLGRDMVASWLNFLQGSGFGDASDPQSPHHYLDDAIDWMQRFSGSNNDTSSTETFDIFKLAGSPIKTSSGTWNTPQSPIDHSASQMHSALDYYNNTGQTQPGGTHYANCSCDCLDEALSIYQAAHEVVLV